MTPYRFSWTCSYMGCAEYRVLGDGAPYLIEVRRSVSEYQRSIFNGTEDEWEREIIASIGGVRRYSDPCTALSPAVVEAFNHWRAAEHAERIAELRSDPERFGELDPSDPSLQPPPRAHGLVYIAGTGWSTA